MALASASAGTRRNSGISSRIRSPVRATSASSSVSISATRVPTTCAAPAAGAAMVPSLRRLRLTGGRDERGERDEREGRELDDQKDAAGERVAEDEDAADDAGQVCGRGGRRDDR